MKETKVPENRAYKVTLILLVGLAAFSTAMKDLNRLQEMVKSIHGFTSQWGATDLVALNEQPVSTTISTTESCPEASRQPINFAAESDSTDSIAQVRGLEIESIDYETVTEPEVGAKVELVGSKKVSRTVPQLSRVKFAQSRNLKEEISAKRRDRQWPAHFEFKTFDRTVRLDLPITMFTDIKREALEAEVSPDFPPSLLDKINRKQSPGKSDNGRREIMIKRFERSFNSRRAS